MTELIIPDLPPLPDALLAQIISAAASVPDRELFITHVASMLRAVREIGRTDVEAAIAFARGKVADDD